MKFCVKDKKKAFWYLGFMVMYFGFQGLVSFGVVMLPTDLFFTNRTASLPRGIYMAVPMGDLKVGDLVRVDVPESMKEYAFGRGWMEPGEMLLKKVGATRGTVYHVDDQNFEIAGRYIGPIYDVDSKGREMPKLRGDFIVKEGHFLPVADFSKNSFDGRYFGDVPVSLVRGKVVAIWTE